MDCICSAVPASTLRACHLTASLLLSLVRIGSCLPQDLGSSDKTLHEQGGNIGDRRLHPKSKILPIFKHINPDGQLVVI